MHIKYCDDVLLQYCISLKPPLYNIVIKNRVWKFFSGGARPVLGLLPSGKWGNVEPDPCHHMVSLGHNEFSAIHENFDISKMHKIFFKIHFLFYCHIPCFKTAPSFCEILYVLPFNSSDQYFKAVNYNILVFGRSWHWIFVFTTQGHT